MILTCSHTVCSINFKCYCISVFKHSLNDLTDMGNLAAEKFNCIFYLKFAVTTDNCSNICLLTTHCCIEWCLVNNDCSCLTICKSCNHFIFCCKSYNLSISLKLVISVKLCCKSRIKLLVNSFFCSHVVCSLTSLTSLFLLLLHCFLKTFFINCTVFLFENFLCKIKRESVSIVKLKCIFS